MYLNLESAQNNRTKQCDPNTKSSRLNHIALEADQDMQLLLLKNPDSEDDAEPQLFFQSELNDVIRDFGLNRSNKWHNLPQFTTCPYRINTIHCAVRIVVLWTFIDCDCSILPWWDDLPKIFTWWDKTAFRIGLTMPKNITNTLTSRSVFQKFFFVHECYFWFTSKMLF